MRCYLCPRECGVNRLAGERGFCQVGISPFTSGFRRGGAVEPPLAGTEFSVGLVFFTYCNLGCIFCQNFNINHLGDGKETTIEEFAEMMLSLQNQGCHNVYFVTPTHQVPQILMALDAAIGKGFSLPPVYDCGGYESVKTLRLLAGIVDIYVPDTKCGENGVAQQSLGVQDYWDRNREAIKEMYRQVGDLDIEEGVAKRGLLIRHLVLPNDMGRTSKVLSFIAAEVSRATYVNLTHYEPRYKASCHPLLNRATSSEERERAIELWDSLREPAC